MDCGPSPALLRLSKSYAKMLLALEIWNSHGPFLEVPCMKGLLTLWCFTEQRARLERFLYDSPSKWGPDRPSKVFPDCACWSMKIKETSLKSPLLFTVYQATFIWEMAFQTLRCPRAQVDTQVRLHASFQGRYCTTNAGYACSRSNTTNSW